VTTGLYSPVNLAQHASSAENIANIIKQGFMPTGVNSPGFQVADFFQPGKKVFTSTSPNLLSQYGDDVVDVISSARNLRLPSGGIDFTKKTIGFGDEIASTVGQANKGMILAKKLRAGAYANSPLARRLLQTGTTVNPNLGIGIFNNPYFKALMNIGKVIGSSPFAGITTFLTPSSGAGKSELEFEKKMNEQFAQQAIAQQQAQTQQNIINQINQANQNNQGGGGGGGGGNVSGPAGMSGPSSSPKPRGPNLVNRAQGGIVSINNLIRRL
tara:strand:+ start:261 stop:1070 length:810 start_codon:yes stop_codon:yes gene_type:complete